MLKELKTAKEIAVDLEHHDTRTYVGLVSLMQISTRNQDWIVDTLKPWRRKLQVLNEVFTDPSILKVRIEILSTPTLELTYITRSFMALSWISSGYNVTLVYTLSGFSILSMQPESLGILKPALPLYY